MEERPPFQTILTELFDAIAARRVVAVVSVISLVEVLTAPLRDQELVLAEQYGELLTRGANIELAPLTAPLSWIAASMRGRYKLSTPDAIVAATAQDRRCSTFITNDARFKRVEALNPTVLSEVVQA